MIALETRSVNKSFGSLAAAQDVSLAFETGLRYAIIGPNGAGKTTYFNLLAGNLRPDSGAILFAGRDVTRLDVTSRAKIGIARSTAEALPPIMIESVAPIAPASPPLTGASIMSQPRFSASTASLRATTGEMLDMSIKSIPVLAPAKTPCSPR